MMENGFDSNYCTLPNRKKSFDMDSSQLHFSNRVTIKKSHKHTNSLEFGKKEESGNRKTFSLKEIYDFLSEETQGIPLCELLNSSSQLDSIIKKQSFLINNKIFDPKDHFQFNITFKSHFHREILKQEEVLSPPRITKPSESRLKQQMKKIDDQAKRSHNQTKNSFNSSKDISDFIMKPKENKQEINRSKSHRRGNSEAITKSLNLTMKINNLLAQENTRTILNDVSNKLYCNSVKNSSSSQRNPVKNLLSKKASKEREEPSTKRSGSRSKSRTCNNSPMNYMTKLQNKENDSRLNKINSYLHNIKGIIVSEKPRENANEAKKKFKKIDFKADTKYYFKNFN